MASSNAQKGGLGLTVEDIFEPHVLAKYDPEAVRYIVDTTNEDRPAPHTVPIEELRADPAKFRSEWCEDPTGWERVNGYDVTSGDGTNIPVNVYHPDPAVHGKGPYGVHLNFHGGGFVLGDLTAESTICRSMCDGAGVVVVDVNYRHCPEATFGKGMEDGWAALQWARKSAAILNIKPDSISIGGISAGAHISIVLQHMARDASFPLKLCMATVPPAYQDFFIKSYTENPYPSFTEFANGPVLPWARIEWFAEHCLPRDKFEERYKLVPDWWWAPISAKNWHGLCETLIRTAECDILRDEGEAYGMKLVEGGSKVTIKRYLGCPHTFAYWAWMRQKKEYDEESVVALKRAHGSD